MSTVNEKLTAIADEIRTLSDTAAPLGLDAMAERVGEANEEVASQEDLIADIIAALEGKSVESDEPVLQAKTATASTDRVVVVTPDTGYDGLSQVTINTIPTAEQAVPSISVTSGGLITVSVTQNEGYVTAGTRSMTQQLTTQGAYTYTPTTFDQVISAGKYLTGVQTIKGDANLVAENIVSGASIFGVTGSAVVGGGSSGGDNVFEQVPGYTHTVEAINDATYGFAQNSSGYWESENKGVKNSAAVCRVRFDVKNTCNITFDVINYAENGYDYALFSLLDTEISLGYALITGETFHHDFRNASMTSIQHVVYENVPAGSHFIDIKFRKDSSQDKNNDSVQFKVQTAPMVEIIRADALPRIQAAETDLVPENIASGVEVLGVLGTLTGGSLPAGVSALASGTVTPASDITSDYTITHNLGVKPNFAVLMLCENTSTSTISNTPIGQVQFFKPITAGSTVYQTRGYTIYLNDSSITGSVLSDTSGNILVTTSSVITLRAYGTYPLKAGYTYRWVCGVLDDVL